MNEGFPHQQEPMPILLAKKEDWEKVRFRGRKFHRENSPHLREGDCALFQKEQNAC